MARKTIKITSISKDLKNKCLIALMLSAIIFVISLGFILKFHLDVLNETLEIDVSDTSVYFFTLSSFILLLISGVYIYIMILVSTGKILPLAFLYCYCLIPVFILFGGLFFGDTYLARFANKHGYVTCDKDILSTYKSSTTYYKFRLESCD